MLGIQEGRDVCFMLGIQGESDVCCMTSVQARAVDKEKGLDDCNQYYNYAT
jgi:hypothetical protein